MKLTFYFPKNTQYANIWKVYVNLFTNVSSAY